VRSSGSAYSDLGFNFFDVFWSKSDDEESSVGSRTLASYFKQVQHEGKMGYESEETETRDDSTEDVSYEARSAAIEEKPKSERRKSKRMRSPLGSRKAGSEDIERRQEPETELTNEKPSLSEQILSSLRFERENIEETQTRYVDVGEPQDAKPENLADQEKSSSSKRMLSPLGFGMRKERESVEEEDHKEPGGGLAQEKSTSSQSFLLPFGFGKSGVERTENDSVEAGSVFLDERQESETTPTNQKFSSSKRIFSPLGFGLMKSKRTENESVQAGSVFLEECDEPETAPKKEKSSLSRKMRSSFGCGGDNATLNTSEEVDEANRYRADRFLYNDILDIAEGSTDSMKAISGRVKKGAAREVQTKEVDRTKLATRNRLVSDIITTVLVASVGTMIGGFLLLIVRQASV